MADPLNLSQLTQEMIVANLREHGEAPKIAAEIAKKSIIAGVNATKAVGESPHDAVQDICFGAMKGVFLIEKDLPGAAVSILSCIAEASHEVHIDPSEMMTWALEGIAKVTALVPASVRWNIQNAIEDQFSGTGEIFNKLCDAVKKNR